MRKQKLKLVAQDSPAEVGGAQIQPGQADSRPGRLPSLHPNHSVVPTTTCKKGLWEELWVHTEEAATFLALKLLAVFHLFGGKDDDPGEHLFLPLSSVPRDTTHLLCRDTLTLSFV